MRNDDRKQWTKRIKQVLIIAGVIIIPLAYSLFYLGAFWDPYSRLDKLPVAVVNEDTGAKIAGKDRNLGDEMVDRLRTDDSLKWTFTDEADGKAGVNDAKYYAMILIPKDFSAQIASADSTAKQTALLTYEANEKRNFLASQILNRAVLELEEKTRGDVNRELTQELSDKLGEVPGKLDELNDGLNDMGSGAGDLNDGATKLDDGQADLVDGAAKLDNGLSDLESGAAQLNDGQGDLVNGASRLDKGLADLQSGAARLNNGQEDLMNGAAKLDGGLSSLQSGAGTLSTKMGQLNEGVVQAASGASQLADGAAAMPALGRGISDLKNGADDLKDGADDYVDGVNQLIGQNRQIAAALTDYISRNPAAATDPALGPLLQQLSAGGGQLDALEHAGAQVKSGAAQVQGGAAQLQQKSAGLGNLQAGAAQLSSALAQLKSGSSQLYAGTKDLLSGAKDAKTGSAALLSGMKDAKAGSSDLLSGAKDAKAGSAALLSGEKDAKAGGSDLLSGAKDAKAGSGDLLSGAKTLKDGTADLKDGTKELQDGIGTAKQKVGDSLADANTELKKTTGLGDFAAEPVKMDNATVNAIPNYGTAFAPYFMSLSLWVGALIMFVGIYLDPDNRMPLLSRTSGNKLVRVAAFAAISLLQACLLAFLVMEVLHLQVSNLLAFYLTCVLVSMVFTSIVEFLIVNLGDIGKFLAIVFLVLQLTACGGTFPMETVPAFFNKIYPYMPMTYSVNLLKETISGLNYGSAAHDVVVLLALFAVFTAATVSFSLVRKRKTRREVQLSLS